MLEIIQKHLAQTVLKITQKHAVALVTKAVININQFLFLYELEDDVDNLPRFFYCLNANIFQL